MIDYEKEITKYGASLSEKEKEKARAVFNELLDKGFSFEWLYYAVQRLEGRSILKCPKLMFYRPFQEEVNAMMEAAREEEREKKARNAEICAKIEAQILLMQSKPPKVIFQPPKPKRIEPIDLAAIADMEDDEDGAMPQNDLKHLFEKTDSKNNLLRRVRGL